MIGILLKRYKKFFEPIADKIMDNIIGCVACGDDISAKNQCIGEISALFDFINSYDSGRKKRLKANDYRKLLFRNSGSNYREALTDLKDYRFRNKRSGQYPDFAITGDMVNSLLEAYGTVSDRYSRIFAANNDYTGNDFRAMLTEDLNVR